MPLISPVLYKLCVLLGVATGVGTVAAIVTHWEEVKQIYFGEVAVEAAPVRRGPLRKEESDLDESDSDTITDSETAATTARDKQDVVRRRGLRLTMPASANSDSSFYLAAPSREHSVSPDSSFSEVEVPEFSEFSEFDLSDIPPLDESEEVISAGLTE